MKTIEYTITYIGTIEVADEATEDDIIEKCFEHMAVDCPVDIEYEEVE